MLSLQLGIEKYWSLVMELSRRLKAPAFHRGEEKQKLPMCRLQITMASSERACFISPVLYCQKVFTSQMLHHPNSQEHSSSFWTTLFIHLYIFIEVKVTRIEKNKIRNSERIDYCHCSCMEEEDRPYLRGLLASFRQTDCADAWRMLWKDGYHQVWWW